MNKAAFALIKNNNNEILLVKSLTNVEFANHWSLPGGLVDPGETYEEAAIREVFEEVGLKCELKQQIRQIASEYIVVTTFLAEYLSGDIKLQTEEIAEARWFKLKDTQDLLLGFNIRELFALI